MSPVQKKLCRLLADGATVPQIWESIRLAERQMLAESPGKAIQARKCTESLRRDFRIVLSYLARYAKQHGFEIEPLA